MVSFSIPVLTGRVRKLDNYSVALGQHADLFKGELDDGTKVMLKQIRGVPQNEAFRNTVRENIEQVLSVWHGLLHENITPFLGVAYDIGNVATLVTPYYANADVMAYLRNHLTVDKLQLIRGIALGVGYLHSRGVIHGDLRGSNVLIDDNGEPRLVDFGLITITDSVDFTTAQIAGPCRWQAPELLKYEGPDAPYTVQSDVYSFAMLVLEIITGNHPFDNRKQDSVVIFDVIKGLRPAKPNNSPLADKLWLVLKSAWTQEPEKRPDMLYICEQLNQI